MNEDWYKNAIIYAIDVSTFYDANGDGIGDFAGLSEKVDYLASLGVTCLWLLPFYPSPRRDNGYDVTNYYDVDPTFGTLADLRELIHRVKERGIRVIVDLVVNHTSDEHPWFQAALQDANSRYRDYYVWTESPDAVPPERETMFPGQVSKVWTYNEIASAYYYHRFYEFEPELKIAEPEVQQEIHRIMEFWLSFDVSGFRIDAASHMIEQKGLEETEPENPHGIFEEFRRTVEQRDPSAVLLGEADVDADKIPAFFGNDDQFHMLFSFLQAQYTFLSLATQRKDAIVRLMNLLPSIPDTAHWVNFLRNLDELDMEQLSEEEQQQIFDAFAPKEEMQIFGRGVRRRLAPMLDGDRRRIQLAYSLMFSFPGSPLIVYGDEIGMGEDLALQGRNAVRTPMQWSKETNAGFSSAPADRLIRPVIAAGAFAYTKVNVAEQQEQDDSLLNWMRDLIRVRRQCPEIGWGMLRTIDTETPHVLVHRCEWQGNGIIAVHNLSADDHEVTLDLNDYNVHTITGLIGNATSENTRDQTYRIEIPAYGQQWYRIDHEPE